MLCMKVRIKNGKHVLVCRRTQTCGTVRICSMTARMHNYKKQHKQTANASSFPSGMDGAGHQLPHGGTTAGPGQVMRLTCPMKARTEDEELPCMKKVGGGLDAVGKAHQVLAMIVGVLAGPALQMPARDASNRQVLSVDSRPLAPCTVVSAHSRHAGGEHAWPSHSTTATLTRQRS